MVHRAKFLGLFLLLYAASALGADVGGLGSNVTGTWTVRISTPGGRILSTAELTQSGNQVKGWLEAYRGERIPLSGVLISDRLIITTHPESRRIVAFDRCDLIAGGNRMKGTFYPGKGKIEFMRAREPHIPSSPRSWHPLPGKFVR
jgi:hypothetical protein